MEQLAALSFDHVQSFGSVEGLELLSILIGSRQRTGNVRVELGFRQRIYLFFGYFF